MIPAVLRRLRGEDGHVTIWVMIIGVTIMTAGGMVYDGADKANQARRATMIANEAGRAASQELSADVVAGEGVSIALAGAADAARTYLDSAGAEGSVSVEGTQVVIRTSLPWEPSVLPLPSDTLTATATVDAQEVAP